ncbi:myeloid differentiation primary response protein MyD88 isoform X2 [Tribolium castaneum]|uniref:myeloid differentiation primary response protein MyD88 isoform X2 n=1 Tax=Tribolium castaneum TaxID=7070 RepID=UPI00046C14E6|nr:PREDICTED: myeloid differentiation primary response protein MyD88 isoform X2 [Tribolium castaneum]|eukprot:XP_008190565.1 PREDICTED: myeloid differentiation primary response protein MyD88 isoform X2 [Tribolium castaneum]
MGCSGIGEVWLACARLAPIMRRVLSTIQTPQIKCYSCEEMDRFDVADDVLDLIDEDIKLYKANPQGYELKPLYSEADKYIITTDDVIRINEGRDLEIYDAFLLYDHDDIEFAIELLDRMEKEYGMKFCVKDRDLVGGGLEMDKMIKLITHRCNRLVVILSDSFFKSSANEYYLSFAHAYGIESQRKIIPCIYKNLTTNPPHMKCLFTLDFQRMAAFNVWDKLRDSIRVVSAEKFKVNRSQSDNGQVLRSALHQRDPIGLRPLNHGVKFSSSVGDLKSTEAISEPPLNPSTSADNLESCSEQKKEKKTTLLKKIKGHFKRDKDCSSKAEKGSKGLKKHLKRATAVAN